MIEQEALQPGEDCITLPKLLFCCCDLVIGVSQLPVDETNEEVIQAMIQAEQEAHTVPFDISNDSYIESLQMGIEYAENMLEQLNNSRRLEMKLFYVLIV